MGSLIQHIRRRKACRGTAKVVAPLALLMVAIFVQVSAAFATIDNTATASGTYQSVTTTSNTATQSVPVAAPAPKVGLVKTGVVEDTNGDGVTDMGDKIKYTFAVSNLGNVTLDPIAVTDPKVPGIICPAAPLKPTETANCTGT